MLPPELHPLPEACRQAACSVPCPRPGTRAATSQSFEGLRLGGQGLAAASELVQLMGRKQVLAVKWPLLDLLSASHIACSS